jgi:hypothetical protein
MALTQAQAQIVQKFFIRAIGAAANTPNYASPGRPNGDLSKLHSRVNS